MCLLAEPNCRQWKLKKYDQLKKELQQHPAHTAGGEQDFRGESMAPPVKPWLGAVMEPEVKKYTQKGVFSKKGGKPGFAGVPSPPAVSHG